MKIFKNIFKKKNVTKSDILDENRIKILKFIHSRQLKNLEMTFEIANSKDYISYSIVDLHRNKVINHILFVFEINKWIDTYQEDILKEIEDFKKL